MECGKQEIDHEFLPFLRVYKDGHVERLVGTDVVPPTPDDPFTGVSSKDITIPLSNDESTISARLYLPKLTTPSPKLPLLVYFHGGGFMVSSPFTAKYHDYLNAVVSEANIVAVSVNYRKAPEHPIPTAYKDCWAALQWVATHCSNDGPEPWLNDHADFGKVFLAGDSAGANIAHNVAMVAGDPESGLPIGLLGVALIHPYFWGSDPIGSEVTFQPDRRASVDRLWPFVCPSNPDNDDPRVNPVGPGGPSLTGLGCRRVLVIVAEKDALRERGWLYYKALSGSGWMGVVEIMETDGEDQVFHLYDLKCEKAKDLIQRLAAFYNRDIPPLV